MNLNEAKRVLKKSGYDILKKDGSIRHPEPGDLLGDVWYTIYELDQDGYGVNKSLLKNLVQKLIVAAMQGRLKDQKAMAEGIDALWERLDF